MSNENIPSLCKVFGSKFLMGNIIAPHDLHNPELMAHFLHHYNAVTAENAMKPAGVSSAPAEYDFAHPDAIVDFATKNNLVLIGHTLNWHAQSAQWLNRSENGEPITRQKAKSNLEAFIKTYAGRYSGRIHSWDVINEAFKDSKEFDGCWRGALRAASDNPRAVGHWFLAYENGADASLGESGSDYVFDAFYFARRYDPHAILYYNDYNEEVPAKRDAIVAMVTDINAEWEKHPGYDGRLLIEGIGMQCHHNERHFDAERVREALRRFSELGVKISITELDVTVGSHDAPNEPYTQEKIETQRRIYTELFKLFLEFEHAIERVTIWGRNDATSWRAWGYPTLFDADFAPKAVFDAVVALAKQ